MANQAASSQVPSTAKTTTTNTAPANPSNAGRKRRSCFMCSKRKVKCDKQKPCICCVKAGIECVFPVTSSGRMEVGATPELVEMLQRLERAVQTLGPKSSSATEVTLTADHGPTSHDDREVGSGQPSDPTATMSGTATETGVEMCGQSNAPTVGGTTKGQQARGKAPSVSSSHGEGPGKIIRDHGRDTYVRRWFWDDGNAEMDSGSVSDTDSDDVRQDEGLMQNASTGPSPGIIGNSKERIMQILAAQNLHLWNIYKERVEPLTKLLHLPLLEQVVMGSNPLSSSDGMQCILLAVYYGAVTSLSEEECVLIFSNGQSQVLSRMREELEGLFAKALLLHTGDIQPLQALTLYLVFLRHHEPRLSWKLSGLATRLAQNFGLHREDSFRGLTKFEVEMRRRLWWQLAAMDAPSAEDYSGEYNLLEMSSFDTHPPQNLDDAQLDPAMTEYPPAAGGITEMTFTLASCQITDMYRCIADSRRMCGNTGKGYGELTPQERAHWITDCESKFSERFLTDCSPTNPFHWVTVILTKMLFHKVRLHGCNPLQDAGAMPEDTQERLFLVAVEVIELNYKLRTDPRSRQWLWLFSSYTQWHAFSLVLVWLQTRPLCRNSRRAWEAIEKAIVLRWEHPASLLNGRKPQQWRLIIKLLEKARHARKEALRKRARRGSANERKHAPSTASHGSSETATSTIPNQTSQAKPSIPTGQEAIAQQEDRQLQTTATPLEASATCRLSPPAATTDVSLPATQMKDMIENPWELTNQETLPGCSTTGIPGPVPDLDFMIMDTQLCAGDFDGVEDLSFLDDLF